MPTINLPHAASVDDVQSKLQDMNYKNSSKQSFDLQSLIKEARLNNILRHDINNNLIHQKRIVSLGEILSYSRSSRAIDPEKAE